MQMRAHNYEKVEKLFQRCLIKILNIDLWRCYLQYIKDTKASLPTFKEKMAQVSANIWSTIQVLLKILQNISGCVPFLCCF